MRLSAYCPYGEFLLFTGLRYRIIIRGGDAIWRCNADSHLAVNLCMISMHCCIFKIVAFSCKSIIYIGSKGGPVASWVKRWSADLVIRFDSRLRGKCFQEERGVVAYSFNCNPSIALKEIISQTD